MRAARCAAAALPPELLVLGEPTSPPRAGAPATPATEPGSHWLPRHRVAIPGPPARYCDRPELTRRCTPTHQRVTVLMAPGGFGKTVLLADACRRAVAGGVPVAWVTLSRDDDPGALDTYLAFAFQEAGIDLLAPLRRGETGLGQAYPRTALLLRALEARGRPCVLALDEAERASDPGAVRLLNHLLRNAPPCLHIAIACRELPPGLDLAQPVFGQDAAVLTAEDLRFSKADIARFFDLELSRRELATVAAESGGWPIALRIRRNEAARPGAGQARVARHVVENWIAARFWDGFPREDRELVLDMGLFDWVDTALLEEVVERPGALQRAVGLPRLAGLLEPVGSTAPGIYRLHPLLREHCATQRRLETPARYRRLHRRAAAALARRGETVEAMRHAALAEDAELAGSILTQAGGVQWSLREGTDRLAAANGFVTDTVAATQPRLAMVRCIALLTEGRLRDAGRTFANAPRHPNDPNLDIDRLIVWGMLSLGGLRRPDRAEAQAIAAEAARLAALPTTRDFVRGTLLYGQSVFLGHWADFDAADAVGRQARRLVVPRSTYLTMVVDSHLGQLAMARGRVREALARYRNAQRIAKARFLRVPRMCAYADVLLRELAAERNRLGADADLQTIVTEVFYGAGLLSHYAATADVAADLALQSGGADAALSVLDEMAERAQRAGVAALGMHLAGLRVSVLADAGRVAEAERTWRAAALPADAAVLDLDTRGWRETEALAGARVRLLAARDNHEEAANLERALARTAAAHGLTRTLMRALALRVRLCHRAGNRDAAREATAEYLALYARSDYARPLVRAGAAAATALDSIIDANPDGPHAAAAERLLAMGRDRVPATPRLTDRQKTVLGQLDGQQDKQIAAALGMTPHGVRYHIRAIFGKLGVHSRAAAVRRAQALGLLGPADP